MCLVATGVGYSVFAKFHYNSLSAAEDTKACKESCSVDTVLCVPVKYYDIIPVKPGGCFY